jgi:asparagine synthase (glutamine-hydrolysing)
MCGIAGFTGFKDNIRLAKIANEIQKRRGPDNQQIWNDENIALSHTRLSIIDLTDGGNQPLVKYNLVVVFNGEIYNYKELQNKLINEKGVVFQSASDTEVVLEMYRCYDTKSLDFLVGMFAFAIYNTDTKEIFIARDHFGIKPLFYTRIDNGFAFSSELKTLIKIPGFDKTINSKSLVSCLNYLWVSGNDSMFENCHKLPPSHYLFYHGNGSMKIEKYWELNDKTQNTDSENKIAENLAELIESSVKRHMVADVPVSAFLSGGLDSSLIAVLAKKQNESLSAYTIGTSSKDKKIEQMPDDERYARILAEEHNLDHQVIVISPDILSELPKMVAALDEPIGDPAAINTYLICKEARKKGVKVLLSGMGADEIFFGYRRQKATLIAMRYNRLPTFIKQTINTVVKKIPVKLGSRGLKFGRWAKRFLSFANLPIEEAYMRSYSYYSPEQLKNLINYKHLNGIQSLREEHKSLFYSKYNGDIINQICNVDIQMFMVGLNLTYSDRASMAASVEIRVPFIDKNVVTEAMQIPGALKIKKGISKYILKKAAENYLPNKIIYRSKASFSAPIRSWISSDLKEMIDDLLSEENVKKRGLLNYPFVKDLIIKDRMGQEDNAYQIYQLLTLELWCKEYLD